MALPSLETSWNVDLNHQFGGVSYQTDHRNALLHFVTTCLGWANSPWTLHSSSDKSTAGSPGPGWTDIGDILEGTKTAARSWIVLQRPNSGGQVLIDIGNNEASSYDYRSVSWRWSPGNTFTGGAINAAPTGTDVQTLVEAGATGRNWYHYYSSKQTLTMHARHSQDGKHDYWFLCFLGRCVNTIIATTPDDAQSGWDNPNLFGHSTDFSGAGGEMALLSRLYSLQLLRGVDNAGRAFQASMVVPLYDGSTLRGAITGPGVFDSDYLITRIEVGTNHANGYGILGRLPDIWAGSSNLDTPSMYPDDGSRTFVQIGDLVVPWDGSMPVVW